MTNDKNKQIWVQAGFGLVEIMIALLLGIIIMLGVTEIATTNSITTYELERVGRRIESASYAMRVMESDLNNAAYWGERREVEPVPTAPPICLDDGTNVTAARLEEALGYPIQGGHIDEGLPYVGIACPSAAFDLEPKAGTDYIAVRRASSCNLGSDGCYPAVTNAAAGTNFHLQVSACFDADSPQDTERVTVSGTLADLDATQRDCASTAPIYRFLNRIYYVNEDSQLVRVELVGDEYGNDDELEPQVLVDNVEMLRFEYGLDPSGDGEEDFPTDTDNPYPASPEGVDQADGARWASVVRVTISLVVRSQDPSAGFTDEKIYDLAKLKYDYSASPAGKSVDWDDPTTYCADLPSLPTCDVTIPEEFVNHRRQIYTRTVSLRNVAGRRQ